MLATMQGRQAPAPQPEAELWMGAHPSAPSEVELEEGPRNLGDLAPDLPFLLKILAIAAPLSLQVHPSTEQAREGFARENARGVAHDAPDRNYKDDRAKPETVVALTEMWLLSGERGASQLREVGHALEMEWPAELARQESAVRAALALPEHEAREAVRECVAAASRARMAGSAPGGPGAEAARPLDPDATVPEQAVQLIDLLHRHYPDDPGMLVALSMNLVRLRPGQAMHTPAQQLHAYVSGTAVEIMGCSDNVLRAGLTGKHMDVPELLAVMARQQAPVELLDPQDDGAGCVDYPLWDPRLRLTRLTLDTAHPISRMVPHASVVLVTEGRAVVRSSLPGAPSHEVTAGHSLLHLGESATAEFSGEGVLFLVTSVSDS